MIQLQSTDADVVERAARIMQVEPRKPWKPKGKDHYKMVYSCFAYGQHAVGWMQTLYLFFGERRRKRIREILDTWKHANYTPRARRGERWMALCHPDRTVKGRGLCYTCYMQQWRREREEAIA